MIRFLKIASSASGLLLFFLAILFNLNLFFTPLELSWTSDSPLGILLRAPMEFVFGYPYLPATLFVLLLSLQCFLINSLFDMQKWLIHNSHLPGYCYLLLCSLFNSSLMLTPAFLSVFLVLIMFNVGYRSLNSKSYVPVFDLGFYLSVASLLYLPILLLSPLVFVLYARTRQFVLQEWITAAIGLLLPYFFSLSYYYLTDNLPQMAAHFVPSNTAYQLFKGGYSWLKILLLIVAVALGLYQVQESFMRQAIKVRQLMVLSTTFLYCSVLAFAFPPYINIMPLNITLVPLAILFAYGMIQIEDFKIPEIINACFLLIMFFFHLAEVF